MSRRIPFRQQPLGGRRPPTAILASPAVRRFVLALAVVMLLRAALPAITCAAHPALATTTHHTPVEALTHAGDGHAAHHHRHADHSQAHGGDGLCEVAADHAHPAATILQPDPFLLTAAMALAWFAFTVALAAPAARRPVGASVLVLPRPPAAA